MPSAHPLPRSRSPPRKERRVSDPRRPSNIWHSQGIHPEGSVSTLSGETRRAVPEERRLARAKARVTLYDKRLSPGAPRSGIEHGSAKAVRVRRCRNVHVLASRSARERVRHDAFGDVRSNGVPMDVVECKKHRESSLENPAKDLQLPSAPSGGDLRVDDTTSSGSR